MTNSLTEKPEPFFDRGVATLYLGDCRKILESIPSNSVDSIVTDPPYGIKFMGKKWDISVPKVEVWEECLRILKPGGHLLAFAGTKTQHRMAVNIEDAGFEIRDMIAWVYGSGFPKSMDISKAIDKMAGKEREVLGVDTARLARLKNQIGGSDALGGQWSIPKRDVNITAPATDESRQWNGWGTALKPAMEPITVARKPFPGTATENVLAYGTGAFNIDGCRIATTDKLGGGNNCESVDRTGKHEGWKRPWMEDQDAAAKAAERSRESTARSDALGRWPANLIHDGDDEVMGLFPTGGGGDKRGKCSGKRPSGFANVGSENGDSEPCAMTYNDSGSAARFFYCAKANKKERGEGNNHPTVKPVALMEYLCRLVTPPGGLIVDPYVGSGTTGKAAVSLGFRFVGIDDDSDSCRIAAQRIGEENNKSPLFNREESPEKAAS